jgi:predicted HTH domain antitoxin
MALLIKDNELELVHMSEEELRKEIAIMLYEQGRLSTGKASQFAGMNKILFMKELAKRSIPVTYDEEELIRDLNTLGLTTNDRSK